ncbi:MAG TPA: nucleoside hydrolase [Candidatus Limnocylindrales bacterium]|nr:nucleoside hydrolase [Candidatus Limnocylindrales bacterium]
MTDRIPLILDVDTGIDDALALLYACASPEADLLAVTTVAGNVEGRQVAANTLAVLELAGRGDVPVHLGEEHPLVKPLITTPETHGPKGIGYAELPVAHREIDQVSAVDRIVGLARTRQGEITLVTLGPLTNLARALVHEPALPELLKGWFMMGGAYRVPGNTTPTTEWNLHVDPDAAKSVFAAWGGPTLPIAMGLDVTERARLLPAHLERIAALAGAEPAGNPVVRFLGDALRFYFEFHDRYDGFYGAFIHDPFVVAAALDPSLVETRPLFVDVEVGPSLAHGMTVADWRGLTGRPPNLAVAVEAHAGVFIDRLVERIGGLAASRASVAR